MQDASKSWIHPNLWIHPKSWISPKIMDSPKTSGCICAGHASIEWFAEEGRRVKRVSAQGGIHRVICRGRQEGEVDVSVQGGVHRVGLRRRAGGWRGTSLQRCSRTGA